jgi:hypothetical protein
VKVVNATLIFSNIEPACQIMKHNKQHKKKYKYRHEMERRGSNKMKEKGMG